MALLHFSAEASLYASCKRYVASFREAGSLGSQLTLAAGFNTAGYGDCPPGFGYCSSVCTDFASDPNNCGGCGQECPSGQICSNGICVG